MKKLLLSSALLTAFIGIAACGPSEDEMPRSTPIDSVNEYGTAPVEYNADDPADTLSRFPTEDDTGRRSNTEAVEEGGHY